MSLGHGARPGLSQQESMVGANQLVELRRDLLCRLSRAWVPPVCTERKRAWYIGELHQNAALLNVILISVGGR